MDDVLSSADFIQASRVLKLSSPLGEDQLLPERMTVDEGVNRLFEIKLSVRAKREAVKPEELIGKLVDVSLEIRQGDGGDDGVRRPFNGLVTNLSEGPPVTRGLRAYTLTLRPQMWLLSRRSDCRIWMDKTSIEVLETLFSEHGLPAPDTSGVILKPPPQHYSVQWNETDLDYLLRRLEEDGVFYWFSHEQGRHRLVVADHQIGWQDPSPSAEGETKVRLAQGSSDRNHINEWMRDYAYVPGKRAGADWNFETPSLVPQNVTPSLVQMPGAEKSELYEYPARIADPKAAERAEKFRTQASEADHERVMGQSTVRFLEAGRKFTPYEEPHPEHRYEEYVITRIRHEVVDRSYETTSNEPEYRNGFEAIPSRVPLTPHRETKRPRLEGAQVAIVAGPSGEEIHPDKYGRIKLWFPWDRRAQKDGSDTCWVRVAQNWAGGQWGEQIIPRIGMEVMVAYIDGDPDRPLVTGVVPNPKNPVPYDLPANKTRMVLRSNTHKGDGFNEMTFEDENGKENMFFHAQKDQTIKVLNNRVKRVDAHQIESIGQNKSIDVGQNHQEKIGGSKNITVGGGAGSPLMASLASIAAAGGIDSKNGSAAIGHGLLQQFAGAIASAGVTAESASLSANADVTNAGNFRTAAGTEQASTGSALGSLLSRLLPISGIVNTVIEKFRSDTIGIARTEQIGLYKNTTVGHTMTINAGEEFIIKCGESKLMMDKAGNVTIVGTKFNFAASGPVQINGEVIDLN